MRPAPTKEEMQADIIFFREKIKQVKARIENGYGVNSMLKSQFESDILEYEESISRLEIRLKKLEQ